MSGTKKAWLALGLVLTASFAVIGTMAMKGDFRTPRQANTVVAAPAPTVAEIAAIVAAAIEAQTKSIQAQLADTKAGLDAAQAELASVKDLVTPPVVSIVTVQRWLMAEDITFSDASSMGAVIFPVTNSTGLTAGQFVYYDRGPLAGGWQFRIQGWLQIYGEQTVAAKTCPWEPMQLSVGTVLMEQQASGELLVTLHSREGMEIHLVPELVVEADRVIIRFQLATVAEKSASLQAQLITATQGQTLAVGRLAGTAVQEMGETAQLLARVFRAEGQQALVVYLWRDESGNTQARVLTDTNGPGPVERIQDGTAKWDRETNLFRFHDAIAGKDFQSILPVARAQGQIDRVFVAVPVSSASLAGPPL